MDDRIASLVVVSRELSVEQLTHTIGVSPDRSRALGSVRSGAVVAIPAKENSWELCERADRSMSLAILVDRLAERILPLRENFERLDNSKCIVKLELAQVITGLEAVEPGFALDAALVSFLAAIGATVDVDQYFRE